MSAIKKQDTKWAVEELEKQVDGRMTHDDLCLIVLKVARLLIEHLKEA